MAASVVTVAAAAGLLKPSRVLAAEWPKDAFAAHSIEEGLKQLYGESATSHSGAIKLKAPLQAENGAVVPFAISTTLGHVESIGIFVANNSTPLITNVELSSAGGYFSARMKMAKTSDVIAVVKSGGKLYSTRQAVKVTVGGCGG